MKTKILHQEKHEEESIVVLSSPDPKNVHLIHQGVENGHYFLNTYSYPTSSIEEIVKNGGSLFELTDNELEKECLEG